MCLTGEETPTIEDKEYNSERVKEGKEGGRRYPSNSVLIDDVEPKQELTEEKNHMVRMFDMTTVWREIELAAPNIIEEDTTPPDIPSWPVSLSNKT